MPQKHATHSAELCPQRRTRSPATIPRWTSRRFQIHALTDSSPYVSFSRRYPRVCTTATSPAKRAKSSSRVSRLRRGINALVSLLCPGDDSTSEASPEARRDLSYSVSAVDGILEMSAFSVPGKHRASDCTAVEQGSKEPRGFLRFFGYNRFAVSV